MQLTELELSHMNLYSPSTGEVLCNEETGFNQDAKSLKGFWINEVLTEPIIIDSSLKTAWIKFLEKCEEEEELFTPTYDHLVKFLKDYDNPTWIVFEITNCGMACGPSSSTVWYVVDMEIQLE